VSVATASPARTRHVTLQAAGWVVLCVLILHARTFLSMASIWSRDATFAHGFLIPFISLWLLWQRRQELGAIAIAPARAGLVCCGVLTFFWLLADLAQVQVVAQAAATAMVPAALWAALGTEFVRRAGFALAYLAFAVPFGDFLVPALMRFTTEFTVAAVRLVGVPIYREGNLFSLPSGNFEVVKACSGVRYLIASLALGVLYAGITYRSWRRRAAFIALSIVVPIIANGLRAFGIVMLAHASQMKLAVGVDHLIYGWLFFGVVMALLFWIGNSFIEPKQLQSDAQVAAQLTVPAPRLSWRSAVAVLAIVLAGPAVQLFLVLASRSDTVPLVAKAGPAVGSEWRATALAEGWRPAFAQSVSAVGTRFESARGSVLLFARDYAPSEQAETALSTRVLVAEETGPWRMVQAGELELRNEVHVRSVQLVASDGARLEVWLWQLVNGSVADTAARAMWLQLSSWLRLERPFSSLVAVATPGLTGEQARVLLTAYLEQHPELLGTAWTAAP
jgi:exosortase A